MLVVEVDISDNLRGTFSIFDNISILSQCSLSLSEARIVAEVLHELDICSYNITPEEEELGPFSLAEDDTWFINEEFDTNVFDIIATSADTIDKEAGGLNVSGSLRMTSDVDEIHLIKSFGINDVSGLLVKSFALTASATTGIVMTGGTDTKEFL